MRKFVGVTGAYLVLAPVLPLFWITTACGWLRKRRWAQALDRVAHRLLMWAGDPRAIPIEQLARMHSMTRGEQPNG